MKKIIAVASVFALAIVIGLSFQRLRGATRQLDAAFSALSVERTLPPPLIAESASPASSQTTTEDRFAADRPPARDMPMLSADFESAETSDDEIDSAFDGVFDEPVDLTAIVDLLADPDPAVRAEAEALLSLRQSEEWSDTGEVDAVTEEDDSAP